MDSGLLRRVHVPPPPSNSRRLQLSVQRALADAQLGGQGGAAAGVAGDALQQGRPLQRSQVARGRRGLHGRGGRGGWWGS